MPKALTIKFEDFTDTLAVLGQALGIAEKNAEGGCGLLIEGRGMLHLLVQDADSARHVLEASKITVSEERDVILIISDPWESAVSDLSKFERIGESVYVLRVPRNGSVKITTRIEGKETTDYTRDDPARDAPGCRHTIVAILRWLRLIK